MPPNRAKILEVIVSSLEDAVEAEKGGADRLEVVRDLEHGGLTPGLDLVRQMVAAVKIPVRVMLRENSTMALANAHELSVLVETAKAMSSVAVDGLVAGYILNDAVDGETLGAIAAAAPHLKITFHRAFDHLSDPVLAIRALKRHATVDRILTAGGPGSWPERKLRLHSWQSVAAPEIAILAGAGLSESVIRDLRRDAQINEIHIGRAARIPPETGGKVCRFQVAQLKGHSACGL